MYQEIIQFWFQEKGPEDWFQKQTDFDQEIARRFADLHGQAAQGELSAWRETPQGALAEIIILDQFSRNMFRGTPNAFACDGMALFCAQTAILKGYDAALSQEEKLFLYMPYMHSESKVIHQEALKLFQKPGLENALGFEQQHKNIIDRFHRYPHRNQILGRTSTAEEITFLKQEGSSF